MNHFFTRLFRSLIPVFFMALCVNGSLQGQTITNLQISPLPVMSNEPAVLIVSAMFSNGSCNLIDYSVTVDMSTPVPTIQVLGYYCMGMLTIICETTNNIELGMLPAGAYAVNYQIFYNYYDGSACNPPFLGGGTNTVSLIVSDPPGGSITGLTTSYDEFCSELDSIAVVAEMILPTSPCDLQEYTVEFTAPNSAEITATYCLGPLDMLCNKTDTFSIFPLSYTGGDFTITLHLKECTGWDIASDSILFNAEVLPCPFVDPTGRPATGVALVHSLSQHSLLFDITRISDPATPSVELLIYHPDGREAVRKWIPASEYGTEIQLPTGIYIYAIYQNGLMIDRGKGMVY